MQNPVLKILPVLAVVWICTFTTTFALSEGDVLKRADSLFQQKRYTQSLEIYRSLFDRQYFSPAMLLKMAFVEEGLNRIAQAQYYLNLYYLSTQDKTVLLKMEELGEKYKLQGYETREADQIFTFYLKYHDLLTGFLTLLLGIFLGLISLQRFRWKQKSYATWSFAVMVSLVLLTHLHADRFRQQAIIVSSDTYVMKGPSAGAPVISIVREGHRVRILGKQDVWVKIRWADAEAYVKESDLQLISL